MKLVTAFFLDAETTNKFHFQLCRTM